jgi:hypothetical protein
VLLCEVSVIYLIGKVGRKGSEIYVITWFGCGSLEVREGLLDCFRRHRAESSFERTAMGRQCETA